MTGCKGDATVGRTRVGCRLGLVVIVVVCSSAYALAGWYLSGPRTFWSSDSAVRFVQLESLRRHGYRSLAALYPAEDVDALHRFYPIAEGFSYRREGRTYLSYPWLFPLVAAPFYGWLGHGGLVVVPAAAAVAASALAAAAAGGVAAGQLAAGLLVGLASPLLVYAAVFWDHAVVTSLAAGGLYLLLSAMVDERSARPRALWAGALLGMGPWLRNEAYLFAAAVLLGLWVSGGRRIIPAVLTGMALPLVPLWIYHVWWFGHPLGYKGRAVIQAAAAPGIFGYLSNRTLVAYDALLSVEHYTRAMQPQRTGEAALVAAAVALGGAFVRRGVDESSSWLTVAGGTVLAAVGAALTFFRVPVMGLIPSAPFVALAWLRGAEDRQDRFLWLVAAAYTAGVVVAGSTGGLQWGPRYLLPILPLLGILCGRAVGLAWSVRPQLRGILVGVLAGVLVSGVALQTLGLRFIRHSLESLRAIEEALRSTPYEVVATGYEPMFRSLGHLYFEKKLMAVDSQEELRELVATLARARVEGWTYVPRFARAFDARLVERWTNGAAWRFRVESDRTPLVVEFGGVRPVRLVTYRGVPGDRGR